MDLDLTDEETLALLNLLTEAIEADRYPLSPRIQTLRGVLAKFGPMGAPPHRRRKQGCRRQRSAIRGAPAEIAKPPTLRTGRCLRRIVLGALICCASPLASPNIASGGERRLPL
jgi:hypothetical protein